MTKSEFQQLFKDIKSQIATIITGEVDLASTLVVKRDVIDDNEPTWLGRLTAPDGSVHAWTIAYTGCAGLDEEEEPVAAAAYVPTFRIVGYRGYDFGTDANNSSDKHMDEVNAIRWELMNNPRLSLETYVNEHSKVLDQTVLSKIDTQKVHITRIDLAVELLPISYTFPA